MTAETFRITARGNGYTGNTTIQDYALLKAAETTKEAGGTHFLIISAADASKVVVGHTASTMQTNVIGQTAFTTYNPGSTYTISAGADLGHRQRAGARRLPVEEDRTRAALSDAAAELGAGQSEIIAQDPQQRRVRKHIHGVDLPIHVDLEARHRKTLMVPVEEICCDARRDGTCRSKMFS
jgi:hypothetical protein